MNPTRWICALILLPLLLAFQQEQLPAPEEPSPPEKQPPQDQSPKPRLDLYGDPLPEGAVARLGTVRFRPTEEIDSLHFSCAGHVRQPGGASPLPNLMEVKGQRSARASS